MVKIHAVLKLTAILLGEILVEERINIWRSNIHVKVIIILLTKMWDIEVADPLWVLAPITI